MKWVEASTLLKAPEDIRELLYNSGVYMVNDFLLPLYLDYHYMVDIWGGRGSGKSHGITDYADKLLGSEDYCRVLFLRNVKDSVRDSLWLEFKDRLRSRDREEEYMLSDREMRARHLKTKNELVSKGINASKTQTAKLKSLAGFTHVILDEADEAKKEDWVKLVDSIRKKGVKIQIIRLFNTPRKSHHIWDDYSLTPVPELDGYFTAEPLPHSGIFAIHATYKHNLHNLNDKYIERYDNAVHGKDQNYYLTDVCGYIPSGNKGQIYSGWERISRDDYDKLECNKYYYIDWGEDHPCAIGEVKMHKNKLYVRGLNYKPLKTLEVAKLLCRLGFTSKEMIICDSSQPDDIIQLRGYSRNKLSDEDIAGYPQLMKGFSTVFAKKGPGSVAPGIRLLRDFEVYVVLDEESEHIWSEYSGYMWQLDKDGKPTDQPVKLKDDHMDGIRYVPQTLRWA